MNITNQSEYLNAYKMHNGFIILKVGDSMQGDFIQKILAIVPNFKGTVIKITDDNGEEEEITLNVSVIASFGKKTAFKSTQKLEVLEGEVHLYTSDGGSSNRAALQMVRDLSPGGLTKAESDALISMSGGTKDYTALLTSINNKASNLETIVTKLTEANTILIGLEEDTTVIRGLINILIDFAFQQLQELQAISGKISEGNYSLSLLVSSISNVDANITTIVSQNNDIISLLENSDSKLQTISETLVNLNVKLNATNTLLQDIKDELDIELVVNKIEKNNGTINYVQRDTIQWDSENGIAIDTLTEYSVDGTTWTTTPPAGDVILGFKNSAETNTYAQDTFQLKDCEGENIGTEQEVIKVVQLNKQVSKICNTGDITTPIVEAINKPAVGKKLGFIQWVVNDGEFMEIPAGKFSTVSMHASKGEFKIFNTSNDFTADLFFTSLVAVNNFIEISADGIGTFSGSEDVAISFDTRANGFDLDSENNSFSIQCVRAGVLNLELYK
jgi:hypothetical protein